MWKIHGKTQEKSNIHALSRFFLNNKNVLATKLRGYQCRQLFKYQIVKFTKFRSSHVCFDYYIFLGRAWNLKIYSRRQLLPYNNAHTQPFAIMPIPDPLRNMIPSVNYGAWRLSIKLRSGIECKSLYVGEEESARDRYTATIFLSSVRAWMRKMELRTESIYHIKMDWS